MTFDEILKWVGASASLLWLPFIYEKWKKFRPQDVYVVFDEQAHIGFNTNGSYISVRVAMCAPKSNDIVFGKYQAKITCDSGAEIELHANHIENSITEKLVNNSSNESFSTVKTRSDILTLLKSGCITDKDVNFFVSSYKKKLGVFWDEFTQKISHFSKNNEPKSGLLKEQETTKLIENIKAQYIWQSGKYTFTLLANPQSGRVNMKNNKFSFELTTEDCTILESNKNMIEKAFENYLNGNSEKANFTFISKDIKQNI